MAVDGTVLPVPDSRANARVFGYPSTRPETKAAFPKVRLVILIETGTHLIVDALMCPYRIGERVRAKKLLRSVTRGMLLMWDRVLHSYAMVDATRVQGCDYLGRIPKNVKFSVEKVLDDGSYLSWIAPDGKSKKKGCGKILLRVVEYTIDEAGTPQTYRLITSLMDIALVSRLIASSRISSTLSRLKIRLMNSKLISTGAKLPSVLLSPVKSFKKSMAGCSDTMQYGV